MFLDLKHLYKKNIFPHSLSHYRYPKDVTSSGSYGKLRRIYILFVHRISEHFVENSITLINVLRMMLLIPAPPRPNRLSFKQILLKI